MAHQLNRVWKDKDAENTSSDLHFTWLCISEALTLDVEDQDPPDGAQMIEGGVLDVEGGRVVDIGRQELNVYFT